MKCEDHNDGIRKHQKCATSNSSQKEKGNENRTSFEIHEYRGTLQKVEELQQTENTEEDGKPERESKVMEAEKATTQKSGKKQWQDQNKEKIKRKETQIRKT